MPKPQQRQNVTAIIYDKQGKVLSIGKNSYVKTHPLQYKYAKKTKLYDKIFLHAEISAIAKCKNLEDAHRMFISRWYKNGEPANAKPCEVCAAALAETNIKIVDYT